MAAGSTRSTNQAETDRPRYAARGTPFWSWAADGENKASDSLLRQGSRTANRLAPWALRKPRVTRVAGINAGEHSRKRSATPLLWINLARIHPHPRLL